MSHKSKDSRQRLFNMDLTFIIVSRNREIKPPYHCLFHDNISCKWLLHSAASLAINSISLSFLSLVFLLAFSQLSPNCPHAEVWDCKWRTVVLESPSSTKYHGIIRSHSCSTLHGSICFLFHPASHLWNDSYSVYGQIIICSDFAQLINSQCAGVSI